MHSIRWSSDDHALHDATTFIRRPVFSGEHFDIRWIFLSTCVSCACACLRKPLQLSFRFSAVEWDSSTRWHLFLHDLFIYFCMRIIIVHPLIWYDPPDINPGCIRLHLCPNQLLILDEGNEKKSIWFMQFSSRFAAKTKAILDNIEHYLP